MNQSAMLIRFPSSCDYLGGNSSDLERPNLNFWTVAITLRISSCAFGTFRWTIFVLGIIDDVVVE